MRHRYFELHDDVDVPGRWHLSDPVDGELRALDDIWQFTEGRQVAVGQQLRIPVDVPGRALDFTLAGASVPILHVRTVPLFLERAPGDVQVLPVSIEGQPDQYCILVATRCIPCLDEAASRVQFWLPEDGLPEKVGQYSSVRDLHVDPERVGEAHVFRVEGWPGPLIVSEDIKQALERLGATGMKFTAV